MKDIFYIMDRKGDTMKQKIILITENDKDLSVALKELNITKEQLDEASVSAWKYLLNELSDMGGNQDRFEVISVETLEE